MTTTTATTATESLKVKVQEDVITAFDGKPTFANLGKVYDQKSYTKEEAQALSSLNWPVNVRSFRRENIVDGQPALGPVVESLRLITRPDPNFPDDINKEIELGNCGNMWTPLQNSALFKAADFFVKTGNCRYETSGSIRMGKDIWVSLLIDGVENVVDGDPILKRIMITNSYDGNRGVKIGFVPERMWCKNVLASNLKRGHVIELAHTKNVEEIFIDASKTLDIMNKKFTATIGNYRMLAEHKINNEQFETYIDTVLETKQHEEEIQEQLDFILEYEPSTSIESLEMKRKELIKLYKPEVKKLCREYYETAPGANVDGSKGTLWGAYNALTYHFTHSLGGVNRSEETSFRKNYISREYSVQNEKALLVAVDMAR